MFRLLFIRVHITTIGRLHCLRMIWTLLVSLEGVINGIENNVYQEKLKEHNIIRITKQQVIWNPVILVFSVLVTWPSPTSPDFSTLMIAQRIQHGVADEWVAASGFLTRRTSWWKSLTITLTFSWLAENINGNICLLFYYDKFRPFSP